MCQVHTGAYVSLLAPGKTDYTDCHPRKTTTYLVYITRSIYHYAYARQTQVNWKKETKKIIEDRGNERKEKKAKKKRKRKKKERKTRKTRKDKTRRGSKERKRGKDKNCLTSRP